MDEYSYIDENIKTLMAQVEAAKARASRDDDVTVLLATKYADAQAINRAHAAGICDIGENRVQSLLEKYDAVDKDGLNIHFIGTLQTNKVKYIIDKVSLIHSLDSLQLAAEIDKRARKIGKVMDVLIEINIGDELSKGGIAKEDLFDFYEQISGFSGIRVCGIMTMAPKCAEKEDFRKYFRESYHIFIDFSAKKLHNIDRAILSMGMSDSFDIAIEEGSNLIRVGSAVFKKTK